MLSTECNAIMGADVSEQAAVILGPPNFAVSQADPAGDIESLIHEAGRQVGRAVVAGLALAGVLSFIF
ncbi:hypothetical protein [Desulfocurvus sp. DL9XJH121]